MIAISMFISVNALASEDLVFKSAKINHVLGVIAKYSAELVKTGKVEVAFCGSYGAEVTLKKATGSEIAGKFIFNLNLTNLTEANFDALQMNEATSKKFIEDLYTASNINFPVFAIGSLSEYALTKEGVIRNLVSYSNNMTFQDLETNEYLILTSDAWQDDCD